MNGLEKAIKGLETAKGCGCIAGGVHCAGKECPYFYQDCADMIPDVLALLKAQEPRVMTPIDFDDNPMVDENGKLPAWVEYKRYNGVLRSADGWGTINRNWVDGYIDRRFWTSQPSAEQREATPWN